MSAGEEERSQKGRESESGAESQKACQRNRSAGEEVRGEQQNNENRKNTNAADTAPNEMARIGIHKPTNTIRKEDLSRAGWVQKSATPP